MRTAKLLDVRLFLKLIFSSILILAISACGSKKVNEPKELSKHFYDRIDFKREWNRNVGVGDDGLQLDLQVILDDKKLYSVDVEGLITVVDAEKGKRLKEIEIDERVGSGLEMDRHHLYLTTLQGELLALNKTDGQVVWRGQLTSEAVARPVSNGEIVLVQTIDGKLVAFDAKQGVKRWRYDSVVPLLSLRGTAEPLVSRKYTVASFANGEVYTFDNETGRPLWKAVIGVPKGRTELERLVDVDGKVVLEGDRLYVIGYQGKLAVLSARTGDEIWAKPVSSYNHIALGFSKIFVTTSEGEILALDKADGKELWRNQEFQYRRLQSPEVFSRFVMAADFEGYVHVLNVNDGIVVARKRPNKKGVMGDVIVDGERSYFYTRNGNLLAYELLSSDIRRWQKPWRSHPNIPEHRAVPRYGNHSRD